MKKQRKSNLVIDMRDWAAVITYTALNLWLQVSLLHFFSWWMLPVTVLAYILTDAAAGHLHWLADTYGDDKHPLADFIAPFREHHVDPLLMTKHSFIEANGSSSLVVIPIVLVSCLIAPYHPLIATLLGSIAGFSVLTNQLHKWSHEKHTGLIRALQTMGIILSPELHEKHHTKPHNSHYTITSGVWNYVLLPNYWRWLESKLPWKVQRES